ncbi:transporter substrate-binding domain-containing protein [Pseudomonas putida]
MSNHKTQPSTHNGSAYAQAQPGRNHKLINIRYWKNKMVYKKSRWLGSMAIAAMALAGSSVLQAKEWTSINIATEGAYEPWNLTLPGGKISGFEPELMDHLCEKMKLRCNIVVQNWDGMIASLNAGKFDVLMDAIVITEDRKKVMAFSIPYAQTPASFVALDAALLPGKPGASNAVTLGTDPKEIREGVEALRTALKGKTIGIASGIVYTKFIDENFKDVATVREYNTSADAILDLQSGRIDAIFDDVTFLDSIMSKPENKGLAYTQCHQLKPPALAGARNPGAWTRGCSSAFTGFAPQFSACATQTPA